MLYGSKCLCLCFDTEANKQFIKVGVIYVYEQLAGCLLIYSVSVVLLVLLSWCLHAKAVQTCDRGRGIEGGMRDPFG